MTRVLPPGYYQDAMVNGHPIRRAWQQLKFMRILDACDGPPGALLDVGCSAGSLLSLAAPERFPAQVGVDIDAGQIAAAEGFATPFRSFRTIGSLRDLPDIGGAFQYVTSVEVIEHLTPAEIGDLFGGAAALLAPGTGVIVCSTPNYGSAWPVVEWAVSRASGIDYGAQHITRFSYFALERQVEAVYPDLRRYFTWDFKTTIHWVSPFAAVFGVATARWLATRVSHRRWRMPFGNLIQFRLRRTAAPFVA